LRIFRKYVEKIQDSLKSGKNREFLKYTFVIPLSSS